MKVLPVGGTFFVTFAENRQKSEMRVFAAEAPFICLFLPDSATFTGNFHDVINEYSKLKEKNDRTEAKTNDLS